MGRLEQVAAWGLGKHAGRETEGTRREGTLLSQVEEFAELAHRRGAQVSSEFHIHSDILIPV